jgi:ribosome-associated toxin RatA of RatAB toxin-antitoxin module
MAHLNKTMLINVSVGELDAVVKDPQQWPRFWVGMGGPERVFGDGSPGTKAEFTMLLMGVRTHMIDRTVVECHNDDGSTDWRWEFEGASSGWLTCHHEPKEGGTEITTDFEYSVPGRLLGKAVDRLLLEKRMRRDFENSLENLKLMVEIGTNVPTKASA